MHGWVDHGEIHSSITWCIYRQKDRQQGWTISKEGTLTLP